MGRSPWPAGIGWFVYLLCCVALVSYVDSSRPLFFRFFETTDSRETAALNSTNPMCPLRLSKHKPHCIKGLGHVCFIFHNLVLVVVHLLFLSTLCPWGMGVSKFEWPSPLARLLSFTYARRLLWRVGIAGTTLGSRTYRHVPWFRSSSVGDGLEKCAGPCLTA